jgi:uncharacterized membrane protein YkoI
MKLLFSMMLVTAVATLAATAYHQDADETRNLIAKLGESKHSLLEGIAQAEKAGAIQDAAEHGASFAISAKFELEDGTLSLSVYVAQKGREQDAEHNTLMELAGDASVPEWKPEIEVFKDNEHVARSAMQLTVMQFTKLSLADAIGKAAAVQKGTVYSAIPAIMGGKAVVNVLVAAPDGKSVGVAIDLSTGKVMS